MSLTDYCRDELRAKDITMALYKISLVISKMVLQWFGFNPVLFLWGNQSSSYFLITKKKASWFLIYCSLDSTTVERITRKIWRFSRIPMTLLTSLLFIQCHHTDIFSLEINVQSKKNKTNKDYWIDCHELWYRCSCPPHDE